MKLYTIIFSFMDPTQAMATIEADSPEDAEAKLREGFLSQAEDIVDLTIDSIEEVVNLPNTDISDLSEDRILN